MRVIIIGNGAAGNQAAETIKQHSPDTQVIMIARETHPLYSPCALPDCLAGNLERNKLFLRTAGSYQTRGIDTLFGQSVEKIDVKGQRIATDQDILYYDRLIMATGSRAVIPKLPGAGLPGTFTLKTLDDLDKLLSYKSKRVVVVGSGNIGMEAAQAMQERGSQVTMIEARDQVMPRLFDRKPAEMIKQMLEQTGIQVLAGEQIKAVEGRKRIELVETDQRTLTCDMLIWAVGLTPECTLAKEAGIEQGETGAIKVDRHMLSGTNNVYACGDCAETYDIVSGHPVNSMLWPSARRQGQVAALNCLGKETEYEGSFNIVVGEVDEQPFAALGLKGDSHQGPVGVMEGDDNRGYWRILLDNQSLIGMQVIGDLKSCGIIGGLIRSRTTLQEIWEVVRNPLQRNNSPWLAEAAARFLAQ